MSDVFALHEMDAVKVKVKKCDANCPPVYKKFCIDPRITSFDVLRKLLAKAFDIKSDFSIAYLARDECNKAAYLSLLSDWDLDAALLSFSDPCLRLKVDLQPFEDGFDDWDIICPVDMPEQPAVVRPAGTPRSRSIRERLSSLGRAVDMMQKAFHLSDYEADETRFKKPPMTDAEYRNFLDSEGRLVRPLELRRSVFLGGVDPNLRKYVWRLILNVFPDGLTGQERLDYMKNKSKQYYELRETWKARFQNENVTHHLQFITNLVRKDVLRTDRSQKFFAGSDENKNVVSLFNILTTYAMMHPSVSYCQGMSDLASPILLVMKDEAHAYICFCGLMKRMRRNFRTDGLSMTVKFDHLRKLLQATDPEFYTYLMQSGSDDLLFCYRWLLVELKREFAFDDALRVLEVVWSSLPPDPPVVELELFESQFVADDDMTALCQVVHSTNSRLRCQQCSSKSSSGRSSGHPSKQGSVSGDLDDQASSSSDDSSEYMMMNNSMTETLGKQLECIDASTRSRMPSDAVRTRESSGTSTFSSRSTSMFNMNDTLTDSKVDRLSTESASVGPSLDTSPVDNRKTWPQTIVDSGITDNSISQGDELSRTASSVLPPPHELGDGNPFLMFMCLSILLQHRDFILTSKMEHHFELAMHFDKMVKKHNLLRTLAQARKMFSDYLKSQQQQQQDDDDSSGSDQAHTF